MKSQNTVAIIAGGKSTRFGRDKGLVRLNHRPLIDYALKTARRLSETVILIYGKEAIYGQLDVPTYFDIFPDCGPIGGLHTALMHAPTEWVATIPCDMPLLTPEIYRTLWGLRRLQRPVVAVSHRGVEPLVSFWHRSIAGALEKAIRENRLSLQEAIVTLKATTVFLPSLMKEYREYYFSNVNYPEDLKKLEELLQKRKYLFR